MNWRRVKKKLTRDSPRVFADIIVYFNFLFCQVLRRYTLYTKHECVINIITPNRIRLAGPTDAAVVCNNGIAAVYMVYNGQREYLHDYYHYYAFVLRRVLFGISLFGNHDCQARYYHI